MGATARFTARRLGIYCGHERAARRSKRSSRACAGCCTRTRSGSRPPRPYVLVALAPTAQARVAAGDLRRRPVRAVRGQRPLPPLALEPALEAAPAPAWTTARSTSSSPRPRRRSRCSCSRARSRSSCSSACGRARRSGSRSRWRGSTRRGCSCAAPTWRAAGPGAIAVPQLLTKVGVAAFVLFLIGGLLYSVGATIYADPAPEPVAEDVRLPRAVPPLVIAAAVVHFIAMAAWVVPHAAA